MNHRINHLLVKLWTRVYCCARTDAANAKKHPASMHNNLHSSVVLFSPIFSLRYIDTTESFLKHEFKSVQTL